MSRFDNYFLMEVKDIVDYIKEKLDFFNEDANLECKEIGDGNLNYVFRLKDIDTGKSVIIKQAGETLRISDKMKVSTDRGRIEAEILTIQGTYAAGLVPEVYLYDSVMCALIMQDMTGHTMMRTALMNHEIFPLFSEHISTFLVNTLLLTTDVVMNHKEKKKLVERFINPDLCEISEDLVFSEPYNDYNNRNNVFAPIADFVEKELFSDNALHVEATKCKFDFMNKAQSLIHGDLHTGSVFINKEHTYIFDPEFAFFAPMGYDIGNVIANMFFAWCNGDATIENAHQKQEFCDWTLDAIKEIVDKFIAKFKISYQENVTDNMAKTEGFMEWYLADILKDTSSIVGLELIRRTVGMANVKDLTSISNEEERARVEKICIVLGKKCIMNRENFTTGERYISAIKEIIAQFS